MYLFDNVIKLEITRTLLLLLLQDMEHEYLTQEIILNYKMVKENVVKKENREENMYNLKL